MIRLFLVSVILCQISIAADYNLACRNVVVNDEFNPWEEGFGVWHSETDEDSRGVTVRYRAGKLEYIKLGQASFHPEDSNVTSKSDAKGQSYTIADGGNIILLKTYKKSGRGVVLIKTKSDRRYETLAEVDCSSTELVSKASVGDKDVHALSKVQKEIQDRIHEVDIPFELGDGYYDITRQITYGVYSKPSKKPIGYIQWAHLSYTEGDDVGVQVHFDRNGLRLDFEVESYTR